MTTLYTSNMRGLPPQMRCPRPSPFVGQEARLKLARHVAINTFAQTRLSSLQRGEVATWPVRMGQRGGV